MLVLPFPEGVNTEGASHFPSGVRTPSMFSRMPCLDRHIASMGYGVGTRLFCPNVLRRSGGLAAIFVRQLTLQSVKIYFLRCKTLLFCNL